MLLPIDRTATTSHPFEANRTELTSLGAQAVLTGTSKSASSSNKSAFAGRLTGRSHSSQKSASTYIWLWKTVESDIYSGKILRKSVFRFTLGCSWVHFLEKMRNRTRPKKSPKGRPLLAISTTFICRGPFRPLHAPLLEAYMAAIQSLPGLPSRWVDENRCVTRIHGKWAFRILTQLQHGPTQLSRLRSTLPPGSKKNLAQYLRELERASLIVAVDRSDRMSQARYSLSDPLGIAAVHLINTLAESTEGALEPEPKHRARRNT